MATPPGTAERARLTNGQVLGEMARALFPDGVLVPSEFGQEATLAAETARLISEGATTLFEAGFVADGLFARCDILTHDAEGWSLVEVKSSTKVKEEHLEDLAYQVVVLRAAGMPVTRAKLCRVASSFRYDGQSVSPQDFFSVDDVTGQVEAVLPAVNDRIAALRRVTDLTVHPEVETNTHCVNPYRCPYHGHCHEGQPEHDVIFLPGIQGERVSQLRQMGHTTIDQIPESERLSPVQQRAWTTVRFNTSYVGDGLAIELDRIQFPAHFIDFEAAGPAVPLFQGMKPYQAFPFQWSDHVLQGSGADFTEDGFLHEPPTDPREEFARTLFEKAKTAATIVFYSAYELTAVKGLAEAGVPFGPELVELFQKRGFDLLKVIRDHVYLSGFKGSFSIKKVLPALVPDLAYDGLVIQDGDTAAVEYLRMQDPDTSQEERLEIGAALREYCSRDTLAMLRLYQALRSLTPATVTF